MEDPYDLKRFVLAQEADYARALQERRAGRKQSHWMWYVFPQFDGLGFSATSKLYAVKSVAEAKAYLIHPVLGPRLIECAEALLTHDGLSAWEILGSPDDMKLHSSATLFDAVSSPGSVFRRLLDKYSPNALCEKFGPKKHVWSRNLEIQRVTMPTARMTSAACFTSRPKL